MGIEDLRKKIYRSRKKSVYVSFFKKASWLLKSSSNRVSLVNSRYLGKEKTGIAAQTKIRTAFIGTSKTVDKIQAIRSTVRTEAPTKIEVKLKVNLSKNPDAPNFFSLPSTESLL